MPTWRPSCLHPICIGHAGGNRPRFFPTSILEIIFPFLPKLYSTRGTKAMVNHIINRDSGFVFVSKCYINIVIRVRRSSRTVFAKRSLLDC